MQQTYLFYDLETSGLNKCFDQMLQFAAIRTDPALNELERYNFLIKLNPDTVPSPRAILTHQISLTKLAQEGICEYEAAKLIHKLFNTPFTISIGYNNLGFDDEFLRFTFYRNLLPPYTHQYANGCGRVDLYPITVIYYLFHREVLNWPQINNVPTLKLEHLSSANQLAAKNAHDAMTDVIATLELARRLYKKQKIWQYLQGYFDKSTDVERHNKLDIGLTINNHLYPEAILIDGSLGAKNHYQTIGVTLGGHKHYGNQLLWLDLDNPNIANIKDDNIATMTRIYRKKLGEPPITLPLIPRLMFHLSHERRNLITKNYSWLQQNQQLFQAIANYHQEYTYPVITNLDIDAALYQDGFLSDYERQLCQKFHAANIQEKIDLLQQFPNPKLRIQALRLLGRNYFYELPQKLREEFSSYLAKLNIEDANTVTRDYRNELRLTAKEVLSEIHQLQQNPNLSETNIKLLVELEKYLNSAFYCALTVL